VGRFPLFAPAGSEWFEAASKVVTIYLIDSRIVAPRRVPNGFGASFAPGNASRGSGGIRVQTSSSRSAARDRILLVVLAAIVISAGIGLRDPWPADEPRFALVAREMVESGDWLFPHRAGELYADKPPVFFWAIALAYVATGSIRIAFLLPTLFAGILTLLLVHDLALRLWGRRVAMTAGLALLVTVQFTLQARSAQIDGFLVLLTTLGIYGLIRHFVLGPAWRWWYIAFFAMGLGVITKGVGFLPALMLIPLGWGRAKGWRRLPRFPFPAKHIVLGIVVMLAVILAWLIPMVAAVATSADPQLVAYRDNILLKQTGTRYAKAWHHRQWFGYFVFQVLPWAWLPLSLALPWAIPAWWRRLKRRDGLLLALLGWIVLVLVFFSASPGKRGVYVLPLVPAMLLAFAPMIEPLMRRRGVQRTAFGFLIAFGVFLVAICAAVWLVPGKIPVTVEDVVTATLVPPIALLGALALLFAFAGSRRAVITLPLFLGVAWIVAGWWLLPMLNSGRSAAPLMDRVATAIGPGSEIGVVAWREQFALHADRPIVTFGYGRRDLDQETVDAARWVAGSSNRWLMIPNESLSCFDEKKAIKLGSRSRRIWYLVRRDAITPNCSATAGGSVVE
jgi:4-amino-4-deoxy-L-arabinose transferase-like glycosyltransferase